MKKWLNMLFFSLILAYLGFKLSFFILKESLVLSRDIQLEIEVATDQENAYDASANFLPSFAGANVYKGALHSGENVMQIPISRYEQVRRIFIIFEKPVSLRIKSLSYLGAYRTISVPQDSVLKYLKGYTSQLDKQISPEFKDQRVVISSSMTYPIIAIENKINAILYEGLLTPLRRIAIGLGALIFVISIIWLRSPKSKLEVKGKLNFCALFIAIIFTPFLSQKENESNENRNLAAFPELNQNIWRIPSKYNSFYDDRFPYRNLLNKAYNYLIITAFNTSPVPNFFQIGKEGWLFYSSKDVQRVYRAEEQFTLDQLEAIRKKYELINQELEKRGVKFYMLIPPLKHTVYPEYLPENLKIFKGRVTKREQMIGYLREHTDIPILDPLPRLLDLKDSIQTYFKTDTHWDNLAAFKVYQDVIREVRKDFPELGGELKEEDFEITKIEITSGDLVNNLNVDDLFHSDKYILIQKENKRSGMINVGKAIQDEQSFTYYQSDSLKGKPRLLMYRDSYSEFLHPYLSEHFSYSAFSWSHNISLERVNREKPDLVILEMMERFLDHAPK
jgi:hypothetical protein